MHVSIHCYANIRSWVNKMLENFLEKAARRRGKLYDIKTLHNYHLGTIKINTITSYRNKLTVAKYSHCIYENYELYVQTLLNVFIPTSLFLLWFQLTVRESNNYFFIALGHSYILIVISVSFKLQNLQMPDVDPLKLQIVTVFLHCYSELIWVHTEPSEIAAFDIQSTSLLPKCIRHF